MEAATITVTGTHVIKTGNGNETLTTCKIEKGNIDTNHPSGKMSYYELKTKDGDIYRVPMSEIYHKTQTVTGEEGTYIGFWFPTKDKGWVPEIGQALTVKLFVH